jgi:hypothetical protein
MTLLTLNLLLLLLLLLLLFAGQLACRLQLCPVPGAA